MKDYMLFLETIDHQKEINGNIMKQCKKKELLIDLQEIRNKRLELNKKEKEILLKISQLNTRVLKS